MAEKVLKGITCPACSGELDLREGIRTFNCKYCGTLLLAKGSEGVVKYYVPKKIQRNIAIQKTFEWLGKGLSKARGLKNSAKLDDAFLVYIPYWRVRADVIGWVFGKERRTQTVNGRTSTYYVDVERKIQKTYDQTYAACDIAELGVQKVNLSGDEIKPVNFEELQSEGMLFNIISSEKEITDYAKSQFTEDAVSSVNVDQITFQHNDLVRPNVSIVYYPLWVVRYIHNGRTYQVVVDGEDGTICYGKAPGNNLYRAVAGILGTALGSYCLTFFGIFGLIGDSDSAEAIIALFIFLVIVGIAMMIWGYRKFRYGGEIEEGTGIVKESPKTVFGKKMDSNFKNIASTFDTAGIISSIMKR
ncbi:MAG: phage holin family protein [Ignavibacteria bacterium]|nr:phage holin family protein [Ignavibacteria bacterium]